MQVIIIELTDIREAERKCKGEGQDFENIPGRCRSLHWRTIMESGLQN